MKKYIVLIFIFIISALRADCAFITHPQKKDVTVTTSKIFFTGGIEKDERLIINDVEMLPNEIGAFCYIFSLNNGLNIFKITTLKKEDEPITEEYKIIKKEYRSGNINSNYIEEQPKYYKTLKDNVILRSTPVNAGINRLGYLPKDTKLYIAGKKNGFAKVYLTKNDYCWVQTKDITPIENSSEYLPQKILSEEFNCDNNCNRTTMKLSENLPYSITTDSNGIVLNIYNLENDNELEQRHFKTNELTRYSIKEEDNTLEVILKDTPIEKLYRNKKGIKIIIDAGHGGSEKGAVGCLGDLEKDINLDIAQNLKKILESKKYEVYMTRDCDKFLSLQDRIDIAKENDVLFFVSIHLNSVPINQDPAQHSGSTIYYYNDNCKNFAQEVADSLTKELVIKNNGIKQASFAVIRPTEYIGILAEVVFMVNPNDTIIYKDCEFAKKAAKAICQGITKYLYNISSKK